MKISGSKKLKAGLPLAWKAVPLSDFRIEYGDGLTKRDRDGGSIPVYGSNGIVGWHTQARTNGATIIIGRKGSVGAVHISEIPCWPIDTTYYIDEFPSDFDYKFLYYFLRSQTISDLDTSTAIPGINRNDLGNIVVPKPPLDEQRRIVAKLESILAQIRTARAALHRIPPTLKALRQSVLAAAFRGELIDYEQIDRTPLLPLSQVIERIKTGPFGSTLHKSDYVINGCPVINPMHIINGKIVPSPNMAISQNKAADLSEFRLAEGDIIIGRRGEMGRCAVVSKIEHGWICGTGSMALRPKSFILPGYLQLFLSSPDTITALEENSVGTTMLNLNQKILLNLAVRVPDIEVQEIVIQRINSAISFAGIVESVAKNASDKLDELEQSALAKAFRGELV